MQSLLPKDTFLRIIFDFTTADDWDCVAAVERLPVFHYSVDFIVLSFWIVSSSAVCDCGISWSYSLTFFYCGTLKISEGQSFQPIFLIGTCPMCKFFLRIIGGLIELPFQRKKYHYLWNFYLAISMGNFSLRLFEVLALLLNLYILTISLYGIRSHLSTTCNIPRNMR